MKKKILIKSYEYEFDNEIYVVCTATFFLKDSYGETLLVDGITIFDEKKIFVCLLDQQIKSVVRMFELLDNNVEITYSLNHKE